MKIAAAVILPNVGGWAGGIITQQNIKPWYESLNKPKFNPPNYLFGPVWTGIYCGIGYASYLVYDELLASGNGFNRTAQMALALYANQLVLNWAWTPIFFKYHSLKWSAVELSVLTASSAACGYAFGQINRTAGYLFVPYLAWLSYALYLNVSIYLKNKPAIEGAKASESKTE